MTYPRRIRTLLAFLLCVLMTAVVTPVPLQAQATPTDSKSETSTKPKRHHKHLTTADSAEPAGTTPAVASAGTTPQANSPAANQAPANSATPNKTKTAAGNSGPEITAAQASGKVWVNLDSGIYHKSGRWYGKTKNGKFMTEADAKAAGYKQAKRN